MTNIIGFFSDYAKPLLLVGAFVVIILLMLAPDWKGRVMVILMALYAVITVMALVLSPFCQPENPLAVTEVNATYFLIALAGACWVIAAALAHRHAYKFALACLAIPPVLSILIIAIIRSQGQVKCAPFISP